MSGSDVLVLLPPVLRRLFPGSTAEIVLSADTVADAIAKLDTVWPGMADRIADSRPAIRKHINIFVDGEKAGLTTRLRPGAEMIVMTAISGGAHVAPT